MWLVREHLGEDAEAVQRDSGAVRGIPAAAGILGGGLHADEVARAVRRTRARIVHAHNVHPTYGWRALAAARAAGAAVVMHLHQYRLVCAIGICFRDGHECTRCHGRNTLPGVVLNCRGSVPEAIAYGAGLALWQRRTAAQVDAFITPSRFALSRLHEIGAPVGETFIVPHVTRRMAAAPPEQRGRHALVASRLVPEKGIAVAVDACREAGVPLIIAGDGPERDRLDRSQGVRRGGAGPSAESHVTFTGRVGVAELERLRRDAAVALVPSLSAETFGLAAAEAMAAGIPVAASHVGALPELVPREWLSPPGDAPALAATIRWLIADSSAGGRALQCARSTTAPGVVASALAEVYDYAQGRRRYPAPRESTTALPG
jgi:glycosyltransferase involved in cell wall biosynthesis